MPYTDQQTYHGRYG